MPPRGTTRPLEYAALHTERKVKLYDKGRYSQIQGRPLPATGPPHLLRYEIVYMRVRPLAKMLGLEVLTVADLHRSEVLIVLAAELKKQWNRIRYKQDMKESDFAGLDISDSSLLIAASLPAFWKAMKKQTPSSTYKRYQRRAKQLLEQQKQRTQINPQDEALALELSRLELPIAA